MSDTTVGIRRGFDTTMDQPPVGMTEPNAQIENPQISQHADGQSMPEHAHPASERDSAQRRMEHTIAGSARQAELRGNVRPTVSSVVSTAQHTGLSRSDAERLRTQLSSLPETSRTAEMDFLNRHVLRSPNASRALRTYMDVREIQSRYPQRISDDTLHTLTRAVAEPRNGTRNGMEGVMSHSQAVDSALALTLMSPRDFGRMQGLLSQAGQRDGHPVPGASPQLERSLLLKALGARSGRLTETDLVDQFMRDSSMGRPQYYMDDIRQYANQIRGMRSADLVGTSTVIDIDNDHQDEALRQRFSHSCVPTAAQMARAEADPIYAFRLHRSPAMTAAEQEGELESHGGHAVGRDSQGGVGVPSMSPIYREIAADSTNERYSSHEIPDNDAGRHAALSQMESALVRGADVPIRIEWPGGSGHAVLATDVRRREGSREFLISDPWTGRSGWYTEQQLAGGETDFGDTGTGRITNIYLNR